MITCVILSFILVASILWFSNWTWNRSRADVPLLTAQRAMQYADSCVNSTSPWLKDPQLKQRLPAGASAAFTLDLPNGHCDVALYRRDPNANFIDTYATGYYYIAGGGVLDPSGNHAQMAAINSKFMISNVSEYLTAVPGTLPIAYGTNASGGTLYGGNLVFNGGSGSPKTTIDTAYYFNSSSPTANPGYVDFVGSVPNAQRLAYPPSFASLDAQMRVEYSTIATGGVPDFQGLVSAPPTHVYFVPGDLHVAKSQPLVVQGVYVIYVTSSVYIHNPITLADASSWVAILAESNIHIDQTAPNDIAITGNYVSNGLFIADGPNRPSSTFTLTGGVVSMSGISIGPAYTTRNYTYKSCTDPNLTLPNITNLLQYTVTAGAGSAH